jgi:hypothetical protein
VIEDKFPDHCVISLPPPLSRLHRSSAVRKHLSFVRICTGLRIPNGSEIVGPSIRLSFASRMNKSLSSRSPRDIITLDELGKEHLA